MCKDLQNWLFQKIDFNGPNAPARMKAMLVQDPRLASMRERLTATKLELKSIHRELRGLKLSISSMVFEKEVGPTKKNLSSIADILSHSIDSIAMVLQTF